MLTIKNVRNFDSPMRGRTRDQMFEAGKVLHAELAPKTVNSGRTWTGNDTPTDSDVGLVNSPGGASENNLSPAEMAELQRLMLKYSAGGASATINAAGIAQVGGAVRDSLRKVHDGIDAITAINDANQAYWNEQYAKNERALRR